MIAVAQRSARTPTAAVVLLHVPLVAFALLMLRFGWIVQVVAMGCDTGAATCRTGFRGTGELLATAGPSVVLVVSVVVSIVRSRRGRRSGQVPVLGLLAGSIAIVAAAVVVAAGIEPRP